MHIWLRHISPANKALRHKHHWYSFMVLCQWSTRNNLSLWWFNKCHIVEKDVGIHVLSNSFVELQDLTMDVNFPDVESPSTNFWMLESANPMSLRSMDPPACKEWDHIKSGSILWDWRLRYFATTMTAATMSELWIGAHCLLLKTSQMRLDSEPPLPSMWRTRRARAATAPFGSVVSWWRVWPVHPIFWLLIFQVTALTWTRICNF